MTPGLAGSWAPSIAGSHSRRRGARLAAIVAILAMTGCSRERTSPPYAVLATTTSVHSSGLLDVLLPAFKMDTGYDVRVFLAGSGRALEMLRDGDADVVISHAPAAEARLLAAEPKVFYRKLMFNTFVLVGPANDPAQILKAASAADAMKRIAGSTAAFLSRGDESGTHERERNLWTLAGAAPDGRRLLISGGGMATTLRQASATQAYTLTDKPTFLRFANGLDLSVLFEGDPELLNTYAVVVSAAGARDKGVASEWADWLLSVRGRALIANYQVGGHRAFEPWPAGLPAFDPAAIPTGR